MVDFEVLLTVEVLGVDELLVTFDVHIVNGDVVAVGFDIYGGGASQFGDVLPVDGQCEGYGVEFADRFFLSFGELGGPCLMDRQLPVAFYSGQAFHYFLVQYDGHAVVAHRQTVSVFGHQRDGSLGNEQFSVIRFYYEDDLVVVQVLDGVLGIVDVDPLGVGHGDPYGIGISLGVVFALGTVNFDVGDLLLYVDDLVAEGLQHGVLGYLLGTVVVLLEVLLLHLLGTVLVDDGPEGAVAALQVAVGVVYLLEDHLFDASVIVIPYGGDLYVGGSVDALDDVCFDGRGGTVLVLDDFNGVFLVILRFRWIGSRGVWAGRIRSGFLGPS